MNIDQEGQDSRHNIGRYQGNGKSLQMLVEGKTMKTLISFLLLTSLVICFSADAGQYIRVSPTDSVYISPTREDSLEGIRRAEEKAEAKKIKDIADSQVVVIARRYLEANKTKYKLDGTKKELRPSRVASNPGLPDIVHLGQFYKGIEVESGTMQITIDHATSGVLDIWDRLIDSDTLDVVPAISSEQAVDIAKNRLQGECINLEPDASPYLQVTGRDQSSFKLCWRFDLSCKIGDLMHGWRFRIDARTGSIITFLPMSHPE
jgi:Zn-dependent metalloprotease